jgi:hypothetical protein
MRGRGGDVVTLKIKKRTMQDQTLIFSQISITGKLPEQPAGVLADDFKKHIVACALCDWGNIYAGAKPPINFGTGMAAVGAFLGISATGDSLMEYSKSL